ncbi:MAG: hypothetical protein ACRD27_07825, partial [Terracidiphilus sp.]
MILLLGGVAAGQQPAAQSRFAVVSIKPQPPGTRMRGGLPGPMQPGGRYHNETASLATLITFAYPNTGH